MQARGRRQHSSHCQFQQQDIQLHRAAESADCGDEVPEDRYSADERHQSASQLQRCSHPAHDRHQLEPRPETHRHEDQAQLLH